jgi:thiamine-phosphate pyrophosphorylase
LPAEKDGLWRAAQALNRRARRERAVDPRLPPLFFVTDPARTPDPAAIAERLPRGAGVIYRGFGRPEASVEARRLGELARRRGLLLLIGLDAELAAAAGAHGVHLPQRAVAEAAGLRAARPDWLLTGAAHDEAAVRAAAAAGVDAVLVSPVFASASPSAGAALGAQGFTAIAGSAGLPVYALGGVTAASVGALASSGAAGVAAVEGVTAEYGA